MNKQECAERLVAGLMLAYAMSREEAEVYLGQYEGEILTEAMQSIQKASLPDYLSGSSWFRFRRQMAWMEGRNEGVNILFSRLMRLQIKARLFREKEEVRKPWLTRTQTV